MSLNIVVDKIEIDPCQPNEAGSAGRGRIHVTIDNSPRCAMSMVVFTPCFTDVEQALVATKKTLLDFARDLELAAANSVRFGGQMPADEIDWTLVGV